MTKNGQKQHSILTTEHKAFAYDMLPYREAIRAARNDLDATQKHLIAMEDQLKTEIRKKYPRAVFSSISCLNRLHPTHVYEHINGPCIFCGCNDFDD